MTLRTPPIASWDWAAGRAGVVLADVRFYMDGRSGRLAHRAGHLPGAVFVDLDRWLAGPPSPSAGRHPLPPPEVFAEGMVHCGIGDDSVVVAYDDEAGVWASRLVWMLRVLGHEAALLDGGIGGYVGELSTEEPVVAPATFTAAPWPAEALASLDDVTSGSSVVLDARQAERYRGEVEPVDPKAGHIPGARSLPCRENVSSSGGFLPVGELVARFAAFGVEEGSPVISYCGSGVTACQNLLVMEHAGLGRGRLYPGSWSQYCSTDLPVATGP
jgi:thiosulfate/3-mercaptopyruvate sulfurtransferase